MRWPKDPVGKRPKLVYRLMRTFARSVSSVWFREIDIVDAENIPDDCGVLFISWHPSGLIDPMLMMSALPGQMSMIAKHTLFKIPILGTLIRAAGALPIMRASDSSNSEEARKHNQNLLSEVALVIAQGGRLIIFPEGTTHSDSEVKRARSGAARIMQMAIEHSQRCNLKKPVIVPVGLHYSDAHTFREQAAVTVERAMCLPELPSPTDKESEIQEEKRKWISAVTNDIGQELQRASHSSTSWEERHLIWKAKTIIQAEKARMEGSKLQKPSYSESVLSARRLRAGWEFMAMDDPKITTEIVDRSKEHFERLDKLSLHPLDVETRPENFSLRLRMKHVAKWVWASAWMLGIVTISAVIANLPPYYANKLLSNTAKKKKASPELIGTLKVYSSIVMFPLWWIITGLCISWLLLSTSSPIQNLLVKYWLLEPLTKIPPILTFLILLLWCPVSGKLNLTLHTNATRSWRALKRYSRWKDDEIEWNDLRNEQENIAKKITSIGQGLILPGDPEWKNPPTGMDDAKVVSRRC